ncbi:MAG: hypothetical protein M0009_07150 [Deltaproteobacteria bacterium]|nr:hypothetical protein [Deltaproteobacteria bacterium]
MHKTALMVAAWLLFSVGLATTASAAPPAKGTAPAKAAAANQSPVIDAVVLEYSSIERGGSGRIRCIARDGDNDKLTYKWEVNRGSLSGKGAHAVYTAPSSFVDVKVDVYVSDGRGGFARGAAAFKVVCCGYAQKNPDWKP